MQESTREKLFSKLEAYNGRLEKLLSSIDKMEDLERNMAQSFGQSSRHLVGDEICRFWQHAHQVFDALSGAWTCRCRSQHQTQLLLQHRKPNDKEMRLILRAATTDDKLSSGYAVMVGESIELKTSPDFQQPSEKITTPPQNSNSPKEKRPWSRIPFLSSNKNREEVHKKNGKL